MALITKLSMTCSSWTRLGGISEGDRAYSHRLSPKPRLEVGKARRRIGRNGASGGMRETEHGLLYPVVAQSNYPDRSIRLLFEFPKANRFLRCGPELTVVERR